MSRRRSAGIVALGAVAAAGWLGVACDTERPSVSPGPAGGAAARPSTTVASAGDGATAAAAPGAACPEVRPGDDQGVRGLTDLQMVSASKGFAVGRDVILVTDDGRHWEPRYSEPSNWFLSVDAVDGAHAWAAAQHSLMVTRDGGRHWLPATEPAGTALHTVDFVDLSSGWGSDGRHVFRTSDGGDSWTAADPPCGAAQICFSAADDGWAARDRHVFRTVDGGRTWTPAFELPLRATGNQFSAKSIEVGQLACARPGTVWVSFTGESAGTDETPYVVYRGVAAGPWTPVLQAAGGPPPAAPAPVGGPYPAPLAALGPDTAVFTRFTPRSAPSLAVATAASGGTVLGPWQPVPDLFSATALSFPEPGTGWVLGQKAGATNADAVVMTTDGGRTWQQQFVRAVARPAGADTLTSRNG